MNVRLTTHTTYPQMRTETLITMVCFSTHADVRLDMYKQKSCATVMIGSVVHAPHYSSRKISSMRSRYLLSSMAGDPSRLWQVSARLLGEAHASANNHHGTLTKQPWHALRQARCTSTHRAGSSPGEFPRSNRARESARPMAMLHAPPIRMGTACGASKRFLRIH